VFATTQLAQGDHGSLRANDLEATSQRRTSLDLIARQQTAQAESLHSGEVKSIEGPAVNGASHRRDLTRGDHEQVTGSLGDLVWELTERAIDQSHERRGGASRESPTRYASLNLHVQLKVCQRRYDDLVFSSDELSNNRAIMLEEEELEQAARVDVKAHGSSALIVAILAIPAEHLVGGRLRWLPAPELLDLPRVRHWIEPSPRLSGSGYQRQ
jgi:hypothetical protein